MSDPRITVVVLTHNRIAQLIDTLMHLRALAEHPPIIVADNASSDGTATMIELLFPDVLLVRCGSNMGAAGRNRAVAFVQTPYVAFCDDDTWWTPGSLDHAVAVLDAYPRVGILNARIEVGERRDTDPVCASMQNSPLDSDGLPGPSLIGYMAGACVMRTSVFRSTRGYDPRFFIGGEEERVALDVLAAGHAIVYCAALGIAHHPSPMRDSALRRRLLARNAAWTAWQRLPPGEALRTTARAFNCFRREKRFWRDSIALLRGLAWAIRERRRVPDHVLESRDIVKRAALRNPAHVVAQQPGTNAASHRAHTPEIAEK
ncbi:glycosyltransferase family 2 protein [Paraburkholderia rhizosphaerae]|uniref:GT2 family glycosyltransferase n=1 Tax=Paraburkholderia rhizosphaerae TaxID=480658 RepID=A0A4R8LJC9_9BURK|nr:glycosyltransferase [Paraburkholderia rhizosphaerae]TDY43901.1 GT2 family glycosyltransferase [Paraburkholderia rhizosphaerae]